MNKPIIAVFCQGNMPTNDEYQLMTQYAGLTVVAYNVSTLSDSDCLIVDGVCGAVPERFKNYPTADEMQAKYAEYLSTLGINVGGQAPVPPNGEKEPSGNKETDPTKQKDNNPPLGFNQ